VFGILAVTAGVMGGLAVALAGSAPTPDAGMLAGGTASILAAGALSSAMAVGLSALVGSRGTVIGVLLAFFLVLAPLASTIGFLGAARQVLPVVAIDRLADMRVHGGVEIALVTAIAVTVMWGAVAVVLGAWRTTVREI
jgi:hypothetical protein